MLAVLLPLALLSPASPAGAHVGAAVLRLSKAVGPPTSPVKVNGHGFDPGETVGVTFEEIPLATAVADADGSFAVKTRVPETALPGAHLIVATGETSGLSAQRQFLVRTDWSMYQFSLGRTGSNPYENVLSPANVADLALAWSEPASDLIGKAPVVAGGTAYFAAYDGTIYAMDAETGATQWTANVDVVFGPEAMAVANGLVYVPAARIYALDARTGDLVWDAPFTTAFGTSVLPIGNVIYLEGNLFGNVDLVALDAFTGAILWTNYVADYDVSGPPAYARGTIYLLTDSPPQLLAFAAGTGALLWGRPLEGDPSGSPAVADGVVYAATAGYPDGSVYAFDAQSGKTRWRFKPGGIGFPGSPVVAGGRVIVSSSAEFWGDPWGLYAVDAGTGRALWRKDLAGFVGELHYPVEANGVVYAADYDSRLAAFDDETGEQLWEYLGTLNFTVPTIADGSIYFGSFDLTMYAFRLPASKGSGSGT